MIIMETWLIRDEFGKEKDSPGCRVVKMKKKLYVGYDDYNNIHKMRNFEIVEKVPEVGDH